MADQEVGNYLHTHFVSAFQKVGTFRLTGGGKQGGNVASYFCTPDGRVLHVIAGPVSAEWFLREARWVVETWKLAVLEHRDISPKLEALFAKSHADRLHSEHGIVMKKTVRSQAELGNERAAAELGNERDAAELGNERDAAELGNERDAANSSSPALLADLLQQTRAPYRSAPAKVHFLLAHAPLVPIDQIYPVIFERILGEKISTNPVVPGVP